MIEALNDIALFIGWIIVLLIMALTVGIAWMAIAEWAQKKFEDQRRKQ